MSIKNNFNRFLIGLFILNIFSGCGLKKMLPKKSVLSTKERRKIADFHPAKITYTGTPLVELPILPFQIFAVHYDKDIVLVSDHPSWNMHEYAQVHLPDKKVWLMKDSKEGSLDQFITVDLPEVIQLLPEIPLDINISPVKITDNSDDKWLDIHFEYQNILEEKVEVSYKGKQKLQGLKKRNGSTMGHSKNQVMAILDLPKRRFAHSASLRYNDQLFQMNKILGIKKFQMLLTQTQAGLSIGKVNFNIKDNNITSIHPKNKVEQQWEYIKTKSGQTFCQDNLLRTLSYNFTDEHELYSATVKLWNQEEPCFQIHLYPALPDLRRPFRGIHTSKFVMDVNDQKSHAVGEIRVFWEMGELKVEIGAAEPWWVEERPMGGLVKFREGEARAEYFMQDKTPY